jgi:hypothetical protein
MWLLETNTERVIGSVNTIIFGVTAMNDALFIDTILEAQAILARHIAGEHASAEESIAQLVQLLDNAELVKALAERGFASKAFG